MVSRLAVAGAFLSSREAELASNFMEHAARRWVADNCPYQFYFKNVEYRFDSGVLTLRGRVPSFYLKQILQSVLSNLPQIQRIDNFVEVVSSVGLSGDPPK